MRLLSSLFVVVCGAYLSTPCAFAQSVDQRRAQEQIEPYHKHHDRLHGHDHVYPDRGAIFRELPEGAVVVNYAAVGLSYRFRGGVWFEPRGPAFVVVAPPIGLVVPTLPAFATTVESGGQTYLYSNDIYYRARPDLGGYEVVNDPADEAATPAGADAAAGSPPSGAPTPATPAAASTLAAAGAVIAPPAATVSDAAAGASASAPPSSAPAAAKLAAASPSTAPAPVTVPTAGTASTVPAAPFAAGSSPVLASGPSRGAKVFANPKNGQTSDEQARDHYECYRFAVAQSGFDPMRSNSGVSSAAQSNYERAQAACFEGRGYSIR